MELAIYFGMMPVITLAMFVVHKLGYVDMIEELGGDKAAFGYPLFIGLWPLFGLISISMGLFFLLFFVFDRLSDYIVKKIKK